MIKPSIKTGVVHDLPEDLEKVLKSNTEVLEKWNSLTPLARNEWICWVITVKKDETRKKHIKRGYEELLKGKRDHAVGQAVLIVERVPRSGLSKTY